MTSRNILRASIIGVLALVAMAFFLTSFNAASPVTSQSCKETMDDCSKKKSAQETGSGIDLETFTGKFFSSVAY